MRMRLKHSLLKHEASIAARSLVATVPIMVINIVPIEIYHLKSRCVVLLVTSHDFTSSMHFG